MAYYSSHGYDSYGGGYDSSPTPSFPAYGYNEEHAFFNYASPSPYYYHDYGSTMSYSVSASAVPKYLQHNPAPSQFVVNHSTAEFNEPEFDDYDPTPYGGGYDLVETYGKPLPPSDRTCYPRSASAGSIPSPVLPEEVKVQESPVREEIKAPPVEQDQPQGKPVDWEMESESENGRGYYYPWAWNGYETQSGYESSRALGYCACCCHGQGGGGYCRGESQPNWSASYIFGCSGYPYGQGRELGGNYPNPIFGYERHAQEQSLEGQIQYEEPSLFNISSFFQ